MAKYIIPWTVTGEFETDALTRAEAQDKFDEEWKAGAIQPRRDGKMWSRNPIELMTDEDD